MDGPELLKHLRQGSNYTQVSLAQALAVHPSSVTQWESGVTVPRRDKVAKMDRLLHANGALLRAFGYTSRADFVTRAELDQLRALVIRQDERIGRLTAQVLRLEGLLDDDGELPAGATRADPVDG